MSMCAVIEWSREATASLEVFLDLFLRKNAEFLFLHGCNRNFKGVGLYRKVAGLFQRTDAKRYCLVLSHAWLVLLFEELLHFLLAAPDCVGKEAGERTRWLCLVEAGLGVHAAHKERNAERAYAAVLRVDLHEVAKLLCNRFNR